MGTQLGPQEPWPRFKLSFLGHRSGSSCLVPASRAEQGRGGVSPARFLRLGVDEEFGGSEGLEGVRQGEQGRQKPRAMWEMQSSLGSLAILAASDAAT